LVWGGLLLAAAGWTGCTTSDYTAVPPSGSGTGGANTGGSAETGGATSANGGSTEVGGIADASAGSDGGSGGVDAAADSARDGSPGGAAVVDAGSGGAAVVDAGSGGAAGTDASTAANTVGVRAVTIGNVLTSATGMTLYVLLPDTPGNGVTLPTSTCTTTCAGTWPPFDTASVIVPASLAGADFSAFDRGGGHPVACHFPEPAAVV